MENTIELKYPIKISDKEIKCLTAGRIKVKHFKLFPANLFTNSDESQNIQDQISELNLKIDTEKDLDKLDVFKKELEIKKEEYIKSKSKIKLDTKNLIGMFEELTPLLSKIFNITIEEVGEIDFDDMEAVINCFMNAITDQKKN
jgi:hypothetical protein